MWRLACNSGGLDLNSPYTYLMLCRYFADTCAVTRDGDAVAGFIAGFRPPAERKTLFVWQITVDPGIRERRVGRRMLGWLVQRLAGDGVSYLEASVTPSNEPSQRMFKGFARELGVPCTESLLFPARAFPPGETHEDEVLLRIGPFDTQTVAQAVRSLELSTPQ
jgi:L-2,4-diaminobutyric acid acetyltransferase